MIRCEIGAVHGGVPFSLVYDKVTGDTLLVYNPTVEPSARCLIINAMFSLVDDPRGGGRLRVVVNGERK